MFMMSLLIIRPFLHHNSSLALLPWLFGYFHYFKHPQKGQVTFFKLFSVSIVRMALIIPRLSIFFYYSLYHAKMLLYPRACVTSLLKNLLACILLVPVYCLKYEVLAPNVTRDSTSDDVSRNWWREHIDIQMHFSAS